MYFQHNPAFSSNTSEKGLTTFLSLTVSRMG